MDTGPRQCTTARFFHRGEMDEEERLPQNHIALR